MEQEQVLASGPEEQADSVDPGAGKGDDPEIDISFLTSGLYYLRAEMNKKIYHWRFQKE